MYVTWWVSAYLHRYPRIPKCWTPKSQREMKEKPRKRPKVPPRLATCRDKQLRPYIPTNIDRETKNKPSVI